MHYLIHACKISVNFHDFTAAKTEKKKRLGCFKNTLQMFEKSCALQCYITIMKSMAAAIFYQHVYWEQIVEFKDNFRQVTLLCSNKVVIQQKLAKNSRQCTVRANGLTLLQRTTPHECSLFPSKNLFNVAATVVYDRVVTHC